MSGNTLDGHKIVPITIFGWVEITRHDEPERSDEHAWIGALNLGALIDVIDPVSERLFGFRRSQSVGHKEVDAVAAGRGLPAFPSQEVEAEVAKIGSLMRQTGQDECHGYTYATWREIQAAGVSDAELRDSDWAAVFDVVRRLELGQIGSDSSSTTVSSSRPGVPSNSRCSRRAALEVVFERVTWGSPLAAERQALDS